MLATCTEGLFDDLIGKVHFPEVVGTVCFGGRKLNRLFI